MAKTKQLLKNNNSKENIARSIEAAKPTEPEVSKIKRVGTNQYYDKQGNIQEYSPDHPLYEKPKDLLKEIEPRSAIEFAHKSALNAKLANSNESLPPDHANKRAMDEHLQDLKYHSDRSDAKGMLEKINNFHGRVDNLRNELYGHLDQSLNSLKSIGPKDHKHLYDKHIQPIHAKIGELSGQKLNALRTAYDSLPDGNHKDSVLKSVLQEIKHQKDAWSNKSGFLRSSAGDARNRVYDWDAELQNHNNAAKSLPQPSPRELRHYKSIANRDAEKVRSTWGDVSPNANEEQRRLSEAGAVAGAMFGRDDSRTGYRTDVEGIKPVLNRETGEYEMVPVQPQTGASAGRTRRTSIAPTYAELAEQSKRNTNTKNLEAARLASRERDLSAEQDKSSPRNIETEQNKKVAQGEREMQRLNLNRTLEGLRDEHAKLIEKREKAFSALVAKHGDEPLSEQQQREFLINHKQIDDEHSPGIDKKAQEIANQEKAIKLHENLTSKLTKSLKAKSKSASKDNKKIKIDLIKRFIKETALNKNNKSYSAVQYNIFKLLELKNQLSKSIVSNPHLDKLNNLNSKKSEISNKLKNSIKGSPVHRKLTGDLAQADKDIKDHMAIPPHEYNAKNAPMGSAASKPPTSPKSTKEKLRAFTEDGVDKPSPSASISSEKWTAPKDLEPELDNEIGQESSGIDEGRPKSRYEPEEDLSYAAESDKINIPSDAGARGNNPNLNYEVGIDDSDDDEGGGRGRESSIGAEDDNETTRRAPDESSREYGSQDFELEQEDDPSSIGLDEMLPDEERHRPMSQTYEPRMSRERAARRSYDTTSDDRPDYLDYVSGRRSNKNKIS